MWGRGGCGCAAQIKGRTRTGDEKFYKMKKCVRTHGVKLKRASAQATKKEKPEVIITKIKK